MDFAKPPYKDFAFYQKRKKGKWRLVPAPIVHAPVADTHAHLQMLPDPVWTLTRCAVLGVDFICDVCDPVEDDHMAYAGLESWPREAAEALKESKEACAPACVPKLRVACGVHPHNAKSWNDVVEDSLLDRLADPRTAAVGEVGLDYHYNLSEPAQQRRAFVRQIQIAHETGLPLVLHMREAHDEGLAILDAEGWPTGGVLLHCFNLGPATLEPWIERGSYVAFGGPLTFKGADEVRQSALMVPPERLLSETDSPYMAPEPLRGAICGPEHTLFTIAAMANLLCPDDPQAQAVLMKQVHANALALLDREPTAWQLAKAERSHV